MNKFLFTVAAPQDRAVLKEYAVNGNRPIVSTSAQNPQRCRTAFVARPAHGPDERPSTLGWTIPLACLLVISPTAALATTTDPFGVVYFSALPGQTAAPPQITQIGPNQVAIDRTRKALADRFQKPPLPRIDPDLARDISSGDPRGSVRLIVTYAENQQLPVFPQPVRGASLNSPANAQALADAERLAADLTRDRAADYAKISQSIAYLGGLTVEQFWLIRGVVVDIPRGRVLELLRNTDVQYIELAKSKARPLQELQGADLDPLNDPAFARERIGSDAYYSIPPSSAVGMLDTGVRSTHRLLAEPQRIGVSGDCNVLFRFELCPTSGDGVDPSDDCENHGTITAGAFVGNNNFGDRYRGVAPNMLESWKVFPAGCWDSSGDVVVRGLQKAVLRLNKVIAAALGWSGGSNGAVATAADAAFDTGSVVVAGVGNSGPGMGTALAPANARKALAVGAFDVRSGIQNELQSRGGPTDEERIKPDIQAPTSTFSASGWNDQSVTQLTGTSGATPYAAGVAALTRNYLTSVADVADPGHVMARMILSGTRSFPFDNIQGAGPLSMPVDGWSWFGKLNMFGFETITIPIAVNAPNVTLKAALWWPDGLQRVRNDIDLRLLDPSGIQRAASTSITSVFERVEIAGPLQTGTWHLVVRGAHIADGPQAVYWSATLTAN